MRLLYEHRSCGQPAFYVKSRLLPGEAVLASNFIKLDGSRAVDGEVARCGSCGEAVYFSDESLLFKSLPDEKDV